jgi:hypothetical protein
MRQIGLAVGLLLFGSLFAFDQACPRSSCALPPTFGALPAEDQSFVRVYSVDLTVRW